ncbi:MAG: antibiotic biosynthesis monooxygenase [Deltaproteobacteria bacterium]|nr:MAG: antibiotic biosynthesis monooxygenase [Deltaproteobacteria bacterium]
MYAVIFRAEINQLDQEYSDTAVRLRNLAMEKYGCRDFVAMTEGDQEVAISYWETLEQISRWKQDAEHIKAQQRGRSKWYRTYQIQIVEVLREYNSD